MADLRIYLLTDTQATYSSGLFLAVDDSTFTNTKKIAISTIYPLINTLPAAGDFNPASATLRIDVNDAGDERKVTVDDMLTDSDVVTTLKTALGLDDIGWQNGTRISSRVEAGTFKARMTSQGGWNTITGTIRLTSQAAADELLFTLDSNMPLCTEDYYFGAWDDGTNDENQEFYIEASTRNVRAYSGGGSTGALHIMQVTYPAI